MDRADKKPGKNEIEAKKNALTFLNHLHEHIEELSKNIHSDDANDGVVGVIRAAVLSDFISNEYNELSLAKAEAVKKEIEKAHKQKQRL
jgi:hypothetical protein